MELSKVEIVGGGPAGLYAAILIKRTWPSAHVRVREQNGPDDTFGFGVVFSDGALDFLRADDPETHDLITPRMERWRDMTLNIGGETITLDGIGFAAIGRLDLLRILQSRAADFGAELRYNEPVASVADLKADLIIGADGLNSHVRQSAEGSFELSVEHFGNHFAWFGTSKPFETLTQTFIRTDRGTLNAHHYRYSDRMSTFIVECDPATFKAYEFGNLDERQSAEVCAELFSETLDGAPLVTNRSIWRRFPRLWCANWVSGNRVLIGDAAHTAHFSIGSGTRLAMEDAIALIRSIESAATLAEGLAAFQADRPPIARKIVDAANTSATWYDRFPEKMALPPLAFVFDYVQRSGRIDLDRLRGLSPKFVAAYTAWRDQAAP